MHIFGRNWVDDWSVSFVSLVLLTVRQMEVEFAAAHRYKQILKRKSKVFITYVFIDAVAPLKVESSESEKDKLIENEGVDHGS